MTSPLAILVATATISVPIGVNANSPEMANVDTLTIASASTSPTSDGKKESSQTATEPDKEGIIDWYYSSVQEFSPQMALRMTNRMIPSLEQIERDLHKLRDLAVEITQDDTDGRIISDSVVPQITHKMEGFIQETKIGDRRPLRGDFEDIEVLIIPSLTEDVSVKYGLPDVSPSVLGLQNLYFYTAEQAEDAIVEIDQVIDKVVEVKVEQRMLRSRLLEVPEHDSPDPTQIAEGHGGTVWMDSEEACSIMPKIRKENDDHRDVALLMNEVATSATDASLTNAERALLVDRYKGLQISLKDLDDTAFGWLNTYPQYGKFNRSPIIVPRAPNRPVMGIRWSLTSVDTLYRTCLFDGTLDSQTSSTDAVNCTNSYLGVLKYYPYELDVMHDLMCTYDAVEDHMPSNPLPGPRNN